MKESSRSGLGLKIFLSWLPLAVGLTMILVLIWVEALQGLWRGAYDPQLQIAVQAAAQLRAGAQPQELIGPNNVDVRQSLAPFLIIYNRGGQVLAASVQLNGQTPEMRGGISDGPYNENRGIWELRPGVRIATVVAAYGGSRPGFVLAGRSLREVDDQVDQINWTVLLAWIATLTGTFIASAVAATLRERSSLN